MRGKGVRGRGRGVFEGLKFAGIYSAILKIPGLDVFELVRSGLGVPIPRELCWGKFCNDERICCRARIKHASVELGADRLGSFLLLKHIWPPNAFADFCTIRYLCTIGKLSSREN